MAGFYYGENYMDRLNKSRLAMYKEILTLADLLGHEGVTQRGLDIDNNCVETHI